MDLSEVKHLPKVDHQPAKLDADSLLLLQAAVLIERDGWWDGRSPSAGHCAWTAIAQAAGGCGNAWSAGERFARSIGKVSIVGIYPWNDRSSKDQVVAKLRAVALGL